MAYPHSTYATTRVDGTANATTQADDHNQFGAGLNDMRDMLGNASGLPGARADLITRIREEPFVVPLSDEATAITTGTGKMTFRAPWACALRDVRASVNTVSSSGIPTVNIKKNGTTIFTTKLTIDASEKTSVTAATPYAFNASPPTFADDDEITLDIDVAGTGAKGLKVAFYFDRTA